MAELVGNSGIDGPRVTKAQLRSRIEELDHMLRCAQEWAEFWEKRYRDLETATKGAKRFIDDGLVAS